MYKIPTYMLILGLMPLLASAQGLNRPGGSSTEEEMAAGYAALFTCSSHFIMGRPLDDIKRVELVDLADNLPAIEVDAQRQLVRATDTTGFTAIAAYRDTMGCTVLPPHWGEQDVARLPYIEYADRPNRDDIDFPLGDKVDFQLNAEQQAVIDQAFNSESYGQGTVTLATIVIKDGKLVAEQYRPGFGERTGYRTWSTAKSITATLMGIAQHKGILDVAETAAIPEWQYFQDPRQAITLTHLLQMSSGLRSAGAGTGALYFGGQDVVSTITQTELEAEPGTRWKYANADTLLLLHALRARLDDDYTYLRFPYDELLHKIGMFDTRFEMDYQGSYIGSSQTYTTARDLARFGLLYLNDGVWQGERLLPEGWSDFVAASAPALPREDGRQGYGAQFWLLDRLPGVPKGTYTTAGNKGQFSTIVPKENMVIVRTGVDPNGIRWQTDKFIADVVRVF